MRVGPRLASAVRERRLRSAFRAGEVIDLGDKALPAEVVTDLVCRPVDPARAPRAALRLSRARITGTLDLTGAQLAVPLSFDRCTFDRPPDLTGMTAPNLRLQGCRLPGLNARLVELRGDLDVRDCDITGPVMLRLARIGGMVAFGGGRLQHPGGVAFNADGITVQGVVALQDLTCAGEVRMCTASIGGPVALRGAVLDNAGGSALSMDSSTASEVWMTWAVAPRGVVSLINSRVSRLGDNPATWPQQLCLRGLTYETLEGRAAAGPVSVSERLRWLRRDPRGFSPQPYEQLAAYYRRTGQDVEARRVLLAKERARRRTLAWPGRVAGWVQDVLVGYGYRNWLAVGWLLAFWIAGGVLFAARRPEPVGTAAASEYNAAIYALDLLLPVVDLGQDKAWQSAGELQYAAYALSLAGWTLTAAIVAGVTRLFNRG
jgi:hypothetical protein